MRAPELALIQFSDTHICPEGELMHGRVDTFATLRRAIATVRMRGFAGAGFTRIDLIEGSFVATAVEVAVGPDDPEPVYDLDGSDVVRQIVELIAGDG